MLAQKCNKIIYKNMFSNFFLFPIRHLPPTSKFFLDFWNFFLFTWPLGLNYVTPFLLFVFFLSQCFITSLYKVIFVYFYFFGLFPICCRCINYFHSKHSPVLCFFFSLYSCLLHVFSYNFAPPQFRASYLSVPTLSIFPVLITSSSAFLYIS